MRFTQWFFIAAISVALSACDSISASKAAKMPMLKSLPLLTVKSVKSTPTGYTAQAASQSSEPYLVVVNKASVASYVRVAAGDRIKIDGHYAGENPVQITALQIFKIR